MIEIFPEKSTEKVDTEFANKILEIVSERELYPKKYRVTFVAGSGVFEKDDS
jgi:hypothetical protein